MALPVTFATLPTGNNPASLLDQSFAAVAQMGTIYCTATGTNAYLLTVAPNQPNPTSYVNGQRFNFVASGTNTGPVTIQVGGLAAIQVRNGNQPLGAGAIIAGTICEVIVSANGLAFDMAGGGVPVGGGTMTGNLTVLGGTVQITSQVNAVLQLNKAAGAFANVISAFTASSQRWGLTLGDATAESGSNVGSDVYLTRYTDGGATIDSPIFVKRSTGVVQLNQTLQASGYQVKPGTAGVYGVNAFNINYGTGAQLWIDTTNTGTITVSSDYRIKRDIKPLPSMWEKVKALKPISYRHKDYTPPSALPKEDGSAPDPMVPADDTERWGFVAHELQETLIEDAATGVKDQADCIQSPNWMTVVATLTRALQEALAAIENLGARVAALEKKP